MWWELGNACTGHVCQCGTRVSSTCRVCPGSLPLLHLLPRASQGAGTAGFSQATAAGVLVPCHARIHALQWDCGPRLHPAHVFSHEKAPCRAWLSVFSSCLGMWSTPYTGMLGIAAALSRACQVLQCLGCVKGRLAEPTSQGLWQATAAVTCLQSPC